MARARSLFGLDFDIQPGEVVALLGRNGMGKSTDRSRPWSAACARSAARSSSIGKPIHGARADRIARLGVGARARGPAVLSQSHRARTPRRLRRPPQRRGRAVDAGAPVRALPAPGRARRAHGQPALRRRAADAGDRTRAIDQPAPADPGRGHRGPGAGDPRRDLALPRAVEGARADHAGGRQVHREAAAARRPQPDPRARAHRVAGSSAELDARREPWSRHLGV